MCASLMQFPVKPASLSATASNRPVPPPVYRPLSTREAAQAKPQPAVMQRAMADPAARSKSRPAPPVYQPAPSREAVQARMMAKTHSPQYPVIAKTPAVTPKPPVFYRQPGAHMNGLSKSNVVCQPQSARRAAPPVYRPVLENPVSQPKSVHARTAQPQNLSAHTGAAASRVVSTAARRPIMPSRSIQQYRVLAGNKILGVMPAKKPWGGYP